MQEKSLSTLFDKRKVKFSGHQALPFRYGWLEKGFRFANKGNNFSDPNTIIKLGVSKKVAESIRYWCEMTGIIANGAVTDLGTLLLDEQQGIDPYLEDDAALWLLHWKLATNPDYITAGTTLFSILHKPEFFTYNTLKIALCILLESKKIPSDTVLLKDIDCYIQLYTNKRSEKSKPDGNYLNCPFQELNLIHAMPNSELYRFSIGYKNSLPSEVVGYAICEYMLHRNKTSMCIQEALYDRYSPGQIFMLDGRSLIEAVQQLHANPQWNMKFNFTESEGVALIHCNMTQKDSFDLIESYFK